MTAPAGKHAAQRPQPLLTRAHVTAAISGLLTALVMFGVLPAALGDQLHGQVEVVTGAIATLVSVVPPIVHALVSRNVVTPTSSPRDDAGRELVPAASGLDVGAAARAALAAAEEIFPALVTDAAGA